MHTVARNGHHSLSEDIELVSAMYSYFQAQTQAMKMRAGLVSEAANYESGLIMIAYEQSYRTRFVKTMEDGDDDAVIYQLFEADFEICDAVFSYYS
ncbi:hypothetical protein [Litoreibacter roseus]|uniref:Uncharacterized protein n=1 Tax=Litoreibacter roseus TaxID=2601869 RepID=A0A6N6JH46_9RHOB|nr:hypothetical protein [Litoreibacter roseus]GFE65170.1 hypothetical protein KIN_22440 [Litoreibacter roseus]